jgi:hypothetical protein
MFVTCRETIESSPDTPQPPANKQVLLARGQGGDSLHWQVVLVTHEYIPKHVHDYVASHASSFWLEFDISICKFRIIYLIACHLHSNSCQFTKLTSHCHQFMYKLNVFTSRFLTIMLEGIKVHTLNIMVSTKVGRSRKGFSCIVSSIIVHYINVFVRNWYANLSNVRKSMWFLNKRFTLWPKNTSMTHHISMNVHTPDDRSKTHGGG